MNFVLRILFTGLIAFVRSNDGQELTVLLLNANHQHISDGTVLSSHKPLLIARAGGCTGTCPSRDTDIATFVYRDLSQSNAQDALEAAVGGDGNGGAWELTGSDLSIHKGSSSDPALPALSIVTNTRGTVNGAPAIIPTTSSERSDYSWVASMAQVCPACTLDSSIVDANVPNAVVAARLRLRSGNVFTYGIARIGNDVTPVNFQRLDESGSASSYSQAIATWVGADIEVEGDSIEIVDEGGEGRTMTLTPDSNGKVEIAVLNLPPFVPPTTASDGTPEAGKHFEAYYNLMESPPASDARLVPFPGAAPNAQSYGQVSWSSIHPSTALWSDLLNSLRLNIGRTAYDRLLCPPGGF